MPIETPIYNTIMAVAVGTSLLLLVALGRQIASGRWIVREAWAASFVATGSVLTFTGAVMTVTWPLEPPLQFDNIIFGEPCLGLGVLLLVGAYLLGSRRLWPDDSVAAADATPSAPPARELWIRFATLFQPVSWFAGGLGLGLFGIAAAGVRYKLFAAPPQEPISGEFANYPLIEAIFISALYALVGLGAVLLPFALRDTRHVGEGRLWRVIGICWLVAGAVWLGFGALNYFTHIGLIHNTNNA